MGQTSHRRRAAGDPFHALLATARRLRAPGGCAWDRRQTVESLLPYLVEETWEAFEAIRGRRRQALRDELGDVFYTVLAMALIAEEHGRFSVAAMLSATRRKMIRRHPHVFASRTAVTPEDAYRSWQASKRREARSGPSPSDGFRTMLVGWWDWLHQHPGTSATLQPRLATRRKGRRLNGSPKRPRA